MTALRLALAAVVGSCWLGSLVYLFLAHRATLRHFRDRQPPPLPDPAPPVSILRPVEGADDCTAAALASLCEIDYPGEVEVLVGTIRADDPVVEVARKVAEDHPDRSLRVVHGELLGTNRKTSIMVALVEQASSDLLVFTDADVSVPTDYLRHVVPPLLDPEIGCVTLLPRGVQAETIGGRLIALHYDFVYLPQWMAALGTTGIQWAIGHTMAQRRDVHQEFGGFRSFLDALADDYELANRATRLGYRVAVPPLLLDTTMPRETLWAAGKRLLRWKRTIRRARPGSYGGVAFTHPWAWSFVLLLLYPTQPGLWAACGAALLLRWLLAWQLDRQVVQLPDWHRSWPLLPLLDLLELLTFLVSWFGHTVVWAGRRYRLAADGTLHPLEEGSSSR